VIIINDLFLLLRACCSDLIFSNNRHSASRASNESEMAFGKPEHETAGSALLVEGRGNEPPLGSLQRIAEVFLKDIARLWHRGKTEHR
jgi:hypothetical protein